MRLSSRVVRCFWIPLLACGLALAAPASGQPHYTGLWWHAPPASESGWGINFAHQGDVIFVTWFTYNAKGEAWWLSMTAAKTGEGIYGGTLIETTGPAFAAVPFDPNRVARTAVGAGTLTFHDDGNHAQFTYTIGGARQTKALTRQMYGPLPTCRYEAKPDLAATTNYQGLWWVANGAESGWGINLAHENDILFATWFTYDGYGAPLWLSATATRTGPGVYSGDVIRTAGPAYNVAFDNRKVVRTVVGTATFTFADGNTAVFATSVSGVGQVKTITRQLFTPPAGTLCRDEVPRPATVTIETPTQALNVGDQLLPQAVARDAAGAVIPGTAAIWSTSDPAVAAFDSYGRNQLAALAPGTAVVSAMISGVTGTQTLTVSPPMRIAVTFGTPEVVFRWATDRCTDTDTPDQQPRVGRAEDGSIVLFAGNAPRYYVSRGPGFDSLKRDCSRPALESAYRPDPASYENGEWPWVYYREGSRWHAFISNEYHDAVAGTCKPGDPEPANPCWYNSVTYAVSTDGARTFTKPGAPAHVVAPPPYAWVPPLPGDQPSSIYFPQGKFCEGYGPSGIVRRSDGYFYGALHAVPSKSDPANSGMCLVRTDRLDDPASWRAWDGSGFNLRLTSPYVTGRPGPMCRLYRFFGMGSYYSTYFDRYIGVAMGGQIVDGKQVCGVYVNLSADLFHWSPGQLIAEANSLACTAATQKPGQLEPVVIDYLALIDHADPTVNFERPGRTPHLYYVRFNRDRSDPLFWYDRDVVRVPLTFTRLD
jgi:hypothetical protein